MDSKCTTPPPSPAFGSSHLGEDDGKTHDTPPGGAHLDLDALDLLLNNKKKRTRETPQRRETKPRRAKMDKRQKTDNNETVNFLLGFDAPQPWVTEPTQIFKISTQQRLRNSQPNPDYGRIEVCEHLHDANGQATRVIFPTWIDVKNNETNLRLARRMKKLIEKGHTAKAFQSGGDRFDSSTQYLRLAFGRTPDEEAKFLPGWEARQTVGIDDLKRYEHLAIINQLIASVKMCQVEESEQLVDQLGERDRRAWDAHWRAAKKQAMIAFVRTRFTVQWSNY